MPEITLQLVDENGFTRGELARAKRIRWARGRKRPQALTFQMQQSDPLIQYIREHKAKVKGYRDGTLCFHGLIGPVRDEFNGPGKETATISAADGLYVVGRRVRQSDISFSAQNKATVCRDLVDDENDRHFTGVRTDVVGFPTLAPVTLDVLRDKPIPEALRDLSTALDPFDYWVDAAEDEDDPTVTGDLRVAATRGIDNLGVFFEYGLGKQNVQSVVVDTNTGKHATHVHVTGRETDGEIPRADKPSAEALAEYGQIFDTVDSYADIAEEALLDVIAGQLSYWRREPRRILKLRTSNAVGFQPWTDYDIGDRVTMRLDKGRFSGENRIDGSVRIYGWVEEIDDETRQPRVTDLEIEPNEQGGNTA